MHIRPCATPTKHSLHSIDTSRCRGDAGLGAPPWGPLKGDDNGGEGRPVCGCLHRDSAQRRRGPSRKRRSRPAAWRTRPAEAWRARLRRQRGGSGRRAKAEKGRAHRTGPVGLTAPVRPRARAPAASADAVALARGAAAVRGAVAKLRAGGAAWRAPPCANWHAHLKKKAPGAACGCEQDVASVEALEGEARPRTRVLRRWLWGGRSAAGEVAASRRCVGRVSEVSRRCLRGVSEVSRRRVGGVETTSTRFTVTPRRRAPTLVVATPAHSFRCEESPSTAPACARTPSPRMCRRG